MSVMFGLSNLLIALNTALDIGYIYSLQTNIWWWWWWWWSTVML